LTIWTNDFDDITVDLRFSSDSSKEFLVNKLFLSIFILGKLLLYYIPKHNIVLFALQQFLKTNSSSLFWRNGHPSQNTMSDSWTSWSFQWTLNHTEWFMCESNWSDCRRSQVNKKLS